MLNILRKKGVMKRILWTLAVVIILSFGFFGQAYLLQDTAQARYAGKVFGRAVSFEEFESHYHLTRIQAMLSHGENFSEILPLLNLEANTWDRIILLQEAQKRKIKIPDQDVVKVIQNTPMFQRDGRFDKKLYDNILQYLRMRSRDFEEGARQNLMIAELFDQLTFDVSVSDEEILESYRFHKEKRQVSYIFFEAGDFQNDVVYDEPKAREFYEAQKSNFLMPPSINVEYLDIAWPAKVEGESVPDEEKDAAFSKALDISYALAENPDFEQAAQKFGLSVQTSGFFSMEQPNLKLGWSYPLLQKIFQLQDREISEPLETAHGYQILRVKERRAAYVPGFEEAQDKIKEAWIANGAMDFAKQRAEESLKKIQSVFESWKRPDFPAIAKENGLAIYQTPVFARGEYLPNIGISRDFQETAFALSEEQPLSGVVATPRGYAILHLDAQIPVEEADFLKEKEEFSLQLIQERKSKVFNEFISRLRLKANLQDNISKMVKEQTPSP